MAGHLATPVRMSKWSLRTWHCRETSGMGHSEWPPAELLSQKPHVLFKQQFAQVNSAFLRYPGAAFCSMHNCMQWFVNRYHIKNYKWVFLQGSSVLPMLIKHFWCTFPPKSLCSLWILWQCIWRHPAELADLRSIPCAQVTYAAMDLLREGLLASLEIIIGKQCNLLEDGTHKTAQVLLYWYLVGGCVVVVNNEFLWHTCRDMICLQICLCQHCCG